MKELTGLHKQFKTSSVLGLAATVCLGVLLKACPAQSKTVATDEGQAKLMQEVNAGQKSKQLTPKEAEILRKDLSHLAHNKAQLIAKTGRKLDATETAKLKNNVDKISDHIHRHEIESSAQPR